MEEYLGPGSLEKLRDIISRENPRRVFLVTGGTSYEKSGAKKKIEEILAGKNVTHFDDFSANPEITDIEKGIAPFKENKPDLVIAVGGGSVIDMAKSVNILSFQKGGPEAYIKGEKEIGVLGKPLVAIPTTSGTGSEATHFATVYVGKTKYSLAHPSILPAYSIVDPELTLTLPPKITASTGLDALAHAIESYWSVDATDESKKFARRAIVLVLKYLPEAVKDPSPKSRAGMSEAAHLAGVAINITKTTAPHAISYALTAHFGVPHGHAVALTLPDFFVYNAEVNEGDVAGGRDVIYVEKTMEELSGLLGCRNAYDSRDMLRRLIEKVGLPSRLREVGVESVEDLELIFDQVNPERLKNNPRLVNKEALKSLLKI